MAVAASELGFAVAKPDSLKSAEAIGPIREASPDMMVVAAYGIILPQSVLAIPPRGCLNIHASLLPRWRGAAPIQRAILAGDAETGVSIMVMERGLDTGPVLLERRVPITPTDTAGSLTESLAALGAEAIVEALRQFDGLFPQAQDSSKATYAAKIERTEALLDWELAAADLDRKVRALNPFPGAESPVGGETLKIWEAIPASASGRPGTVIGLDRGRPVVACREGALVLTVVQRPGSRRMPAAEYLKGRPMPTGTRLGSGSDMA